MPILTDDSLNYDRIDVTTGEAGQPFDAYVTVQGTSHEPMAAVKAFVGSLLNMYGEPECRIQCTMYTIDRNAVSVVLTPRGWARWKRTIANASDASGAHQALCNQHAQDVNAVCTEFWRTFKAEGEMGRYATSDVYFPCGRCIHWSGTA